MKSEIIMRKNIIICLSVGIVVGLIIGIIIGKSISHNKSSLNEYDQKLVGKWEYGTRYDDLEVQVITKLNEYKEKYDVHSDVEGCKQEVGNNGYYIISGLINQNHTLTINEDGTVEYIRRNGEINKNCEVEIKTYQKKGTLENSQIVFKEEKQYNDDWKEVRFINSVYLVDNETLRYQVNENNPNSGTYLFIRRG